MIETIGIILAILGLIFAFETPRRSFIGLFRKNTPIEFLVQAIEDTDVEEKLAEYLISYYQKAGLLPAGTSLYRNSDTTYPIIVRDEWVSNPAQTPSGISVQLNLIGRRGPILYPKLAHEFKQALEKMNREVHDNPAYAVESILTDGNRILLNVKIAHYFDYVFTAQILDAELRLGLAHGRLNSKTLEHRKTIGVLNFDRYMAKVGLNVLCTYISEDEPVFLLMDRSTMVMNRPLEYPNAIHVVPAGTVQPTGRELTNDGDLSLTNTLIREWAEELWGDDDNAKTLLADDLRLGSAKFILTAIGVDALTQKIEVCGLLVLFRAFTPVTIQSPEGVIRRVSRKELEARALDVQRILPAGALAIWQGLKHLDQSLASWVLTRPNPAFERDAPKAARPSI